jgi:hypothetical protein
MKNELTKKKHKYKWERDLFDTINWDNFGIVFHSMDETDKIPIFKFKMSHGMLPVMQRLIQFEYTTSNM